MPGLVDCHLHPEQVENAGTAYTKTFTDWVLQDFFPTAQGFDMNQTYARNAASLIVVRNFMLQTIIKSWSEQVCILFVSCPLGRQRSSKCISHI